MTDIITNDQLSSFSTSPALFFFAAIIIFYYIVMWKIFKKAGEHGWCIFIPFYSNYLLFKIAFGNGWIFILSFIPFINLVVTILLQFKLAKAFGKTGAFGFGLLIMPLIFYPILAFDVSTYAD